MEMHLGDAMDDQSMFENVYPIGPRFVSTCLKLASNLPQLNSSQFTSRLQKLATARQVKAVTPINPKSLADVACGSAGISHPA